MPRPTTTRKRGIDLSSPGQSQGAEVPVSQHQRFYGPRAKSTRGVQQFLGNLQRFVGEREVAKNKALVNQGIADQAAGTVDEELMGKEAYASAVNSANGSADALNLRTSVKASLEQSYKMAREEGVEWDPEAAFQGATREFIDSDSFEVPEYKRAAAEQLNLLRAEIHAYGSQQGAAAALEEGTTSVANLTFSQFSAGQVDMTEIKRVAEEAGLTTKEKSAAIANGVMAFVNQATTEEGLDRADEWFNGLTEGQKRVLGETYQRDRKVAENRIKQVSDEEQLAIDIRRGEVRRGLWTDANKGSLDMARVDELIASEEITPEQGNTLYKQNIAAQEKRLGDLADLKDEMLERQNYEAVRDNPAAFAALDTKTRNRYKEFFEEEHADASGTFIQFANALSEADKSGDQEQVFRLREQLRGEVSNLGPYLEQSRELGFTPRWIKNYLSAAIDPSSSQFRSATEIASVLEDAYGDDLLADVSTEAMSKVDTYRDLRNAGLSDDQAVEVITSNSQFTLPEARKALRTSNKFTSFRDKAVEELVEDQEFNTGILFDTDIEVANGSYVTDVLTDLAAVNYRSGGDPEKAFENAKRQFKRSHQLIDGAWMPTEGIPRGFGVAFQEGREDLVSSLRSQGIIEKDEDVQLIPLGNTATTGRIGLFRKREDIASGLYPVTTSDGRPIDVHPLSFTQGMGERRVAKTKREGAENLKQERNVKDFIEDNPRELDPL